MDQTADTDLIDLLLVDDHPLLTLGLQARLHDQGLRTEIGTLESPTALLAQAEELRPKVVSLDYQVPTLGSGRDLVEPLTAVGARVVILTGVTDTKALGGCIAAGAVAVIGKHESLEDITAALRGVAGGDEIRRTRTQELSAAYDRAVRQTEAALTPFRALSRRESIVLAGLMIGDSPATIANRDFVSIDTVRSQIKAILRKLEVSSQLEAVAKANRTGWHLTTEETR